MCKEKIVDKIKRLLELSKSSNEHEAALAAARAAEMMLTYQIEVAELADNVGEPEPITEECIGSDSRRVQWRLILVNGLAKSLGGYCICVGTADTLEVDLGGGRKMTTSSNARSEYRVCASPSALATIKYMYAYLVQEIERLADVCYGAEARECRASFCEPPSARAWKGSFRVGCASVIANRLIEQRKQTHASADADASKANAMVLVRNEEKAVQVFAAQKYPRTHKVGSQAGRRSASGYAAGASAGRDVSLGGGKRLSAGAKRLTS